MDATGLALLGVGLASASFLWGLFLFVRQQGLRKQAAEKGRVLYAFVNSQFIQGGSVHISAANTGEGAAHNYHIYVRFPEGSVIRSVEAPGFEVTKGGEGQEELTLFRGRMQEGPYPYTLVVGATKDGNDVDKTELIGWADEDRGIVRLPFEPKQHNERTPRITIRNLIGWWGSR